MTLRRYDITGDKKYWYRHIVQPSFAFLRSLGFPVGLLAGFPRGFRVGFFVGFCVALPWALLRTGILEPSLIYRLTGSFHLHEPSGLLDDALDNN